MNSILKDLYEGKIRPHEHVQPKDSEFQVTNKKIYAEKDYFKSVLSENDYTRLDYLETLYTESGEMETIEAFKRGFEIAMLINSEVYQNTNDFKDIFSKYAC